MAKFCTNCGNELESDKKFCPNCGKEIGSNKEETKNNSTGKSKIAAGVFGILLGTFGVHNFYLGYNGKGVGQLLITVLSCGTLSLVSWLWGLIEGIMILTGSIDKDANGNPLQD